MLTVQTEKHLLRDSKTELHGGLLVPPFECPARVDRILARVKAVSLGEVIEPRDFGMDPIRRIHDAGFLDFLANCWTEWQAAGFKGEAIPTAWPARRMRETPPKFIDGKLGYYALAAETAISNGTWEAALASANVALTAQAAIAEGAGSAFALCRPPGHHATSDLYGGYCFINNAAVAAQAFLDQGASRVAILDVDFHHGNGTQDIFYGRDDVLFLSLHGRPEDAFPYFLGYADETGKSQGEGFTANYPLPPGTAYDAWEDALKSALARIDAYGPDAVVISLGVDTFKDDPISFFKLESDDYKRYGKRIAGLNRPTLFVMEGGYAVDEIGINAVNVLTGFEDR
ncbi:MAG: histone deacetylase family protein [Alphaproteobacteria bacterium]|nr:histone deacetylase family protein [Alphaproteobacteria bacterium]MBO6861953.1 histone deacetylase family protein [Alphaproteobacteria bacterium]